MELVNMIANFGFPALVTAFLLVRLDLTLKELTREMHELIAELRKTT